MQHLQRIELEAEDGSTSTRLVLFRDKAKTANGMDAQILIVTRNEDPGVNLPYGQWVPFEVEALIKIG